MKCPACGNIIVKLVNLTGDNVKSGRLVLPNAPSRTSLSPEVAPEFGDDKEACLVLADSAKASAALSRRCLQHLLREKVGVKPSNLDNEIQQTLDSKVLPMYLAEAVDAARVIGNFAAHPIRSKSTGEIVDVEAGEAEWLRDTLEGMFDFYFVQPLLLQKKKDALNRHYQSLGRTISPKQLSEGGDAHVKV
jgi:Domain of unknown function (DUF4145)